MELIDVVYSISGRVALSVEASSSIDEVKENIAANLGIYGHQQQLTFAAGQWNLVAVPPFAVAAEISQEDIQALCDNYEDYSWSEPDDDDILDNLMS